MTIAPAIRRAAALAAGALALSLGMFAAAGPASAAAAVSPSAGQIVTPLASMHTCEAAGNDGTTQGVFCADIVGYSDGTFSYQVEAMCQNLFTHSYPQCADVNYAFEGDSSVYGLLWSGTAHCGHTAPACPANQRWIINSGRLILNPCSAVWTTVYNGARIELPGSGKVVYGAAFDSGGTTGC